MLQNNLTVLGLMSGTSCDGLDMAICRFYTSTNGPHYEILVGETHPYPVAWQARLREANTLPTPELLALSAELAKYWADACNLFLASHAGIEVNAVASHGHTVYHNPAKGYTLQIGCAATLAARIGTPVVADFRSSDIAAGGLGAPFAPALDEAFFLGQYDACLNIGGFANITFGQSRVAFDICPANIILNQYAAYFGKPYDEGGEIARAHSVDRALLNVLFDFLPVPSGPRALGTEEVNAVFTPELETWLETQIGKPTAYGNLLATYTEYIAQVVVMACALHGASRVQVTGGGALNDYLMATLSEASGQAFVEIAFERASNELIHFKEALLMAYLGWQRCFSENNTPAWATGASRSVSAGAIYLP